MNDKDYNHGAEKEVQEVNVPTVPGVPRPKKGK